VYLSAAPAALAQGGGGLLPFGGFVTYMMPCTCGEPNMWLFLTPLFNGSSVPLAGPLVYPPARVIPGNGLYAHYSVRPGAWLLGKYTPGVQSCQLYVGTGCVPLVSWGEITMTGTSGL